MGTRQEHLAQALKRLEEADSGEYEGEFKTVGRLSGEERSLYALLALGHLLYAQSLLVDDAAWQDWAREHR